MSPTIRSLVIPVSDLDAAKAVYNALLGSPHTDDSYYVGYNINGFEVGLNPAGEGGGPVASPMSRISTRPARPCSRLAPPSATGRVRSHQGRASACSPTRTAIRSACAESSRHVAVAPYRSRRRTAARLPTRRLPVEHPVQRPRKNEPYAE
jgi:hypothetical protein